MSMPASDTPGGAEFIRQFLPTSPYVRHLGMRLVEMRPDTAILALPFSDELVTIGTIVHGGAIASLIDTTAMVAAWSGAEMPTNQRGTTVGLTVTYLAPANHEDIQATASVLRRGRSLVYLDVEVRTASGTAVAKGLVTYKLG
ncbi:MAG TPA: PaaI family thioesterase [Ktedonobacterales bacterium]|nr:PaaI family thioesterase [Ktedonobacterales bacterium]